MPKVHFILPGSGVQKTVESNPGETLLELAQRSGIKMQNDCGGCCSCGTCHVKVKEGANNLSYQGGSERSVVNGAAGSSDSSRLACQSKINGDVTVEIVNPLD